MDKTSELLNKASFYRGYVLYYMIELEQLIDGILLYYFFSEEKQRILILFGLFSKEFMTFEKKTLLLALLIKNAYPEYSKDNSMLLKYIRDIQAIRNLMAHRRFFYSQEHVDNFDGQTVIFDVSETMEHVPKILTQEVDEAYIDDFETKANLAIKQLTELHSKILKKRSTDTEGPDVRKP